MSKSGRHPKITNNLKIKYLVIIYRKKDGVPGVHSKIKNLNSL